MRARLFLVAMLLISVLYSCGIDEYVYLTPPSGKVNDGNDTLTIYHVSNSDLIAYGYEIYYKMYTHADSAKKDYDLLTSYVSSYPTTMQTQIVNTLHYTRLSTENINSSPPLVLVDPDLSSVVITIDFSQLSASVEPTLSVSGDITDSFPVYRGIEDTSASTSSTSMKFSDLTATDSCSDFDNSTIDSTSYFYIQFCLFSYGINSSWQSVFSTGTVPLTIILQYPLH
jgi:hypothetical protein